MVMVLYICLDWIDHSISFHPTSEKGGQADLPTYTSHPSKQTCKVTVDLDNGKKVGPNTARISGSAAACALARERIEEVTQSVMEEAPVSESL